MYLVPLENSAQCIIPRRTNTVQISISRNICSKLTVKSNDVPKTKVLRLVSTSDFQKYNAKDNSFAYWEHKTQTNKHVN
jgi:hypothetical protein